MKQENTLLEELYEKKTSLVLKSLKDYSTIGGAKGKNFIEEHGKNGIYIAFISIKLTSPELIKLVEYVTMFVM